MEYLYHRPDVEQREVCGTSVDAEKLLTGLSDWQEVKELWATGDVPGGERP